MEKCMNPWYSPVSKAVCSSLIIIQLSGEKEKYKEVCQRPTVWEWGMGSLLNYVCYRENELFFIEWKLMPRAMRTKGVPRGCAGFVQHVADLLNSPVIAEVSEGLNHTDLWKIYLQAVTEQWFQATFGSGTS